MITLADIEMYVCILLCMEMKKKKKVATIRRKKSERHIINILYLSAILSHNRHYDKKKNSHKHIKKRKVISSNLKH